MQTDHIFVIWSCIRIKGEILRASKTGLSPRPSSTQVVFLLTGPRRFLRCSSCLFMRLWFHMLSLFCPYFFLIFPSFGVSEGLGFVLLGFPRYLHFCFGSSFSPKIVRS